MFDLRIAITSLNIHSLKEALWDFLPEIKSSHRVEALARGLGFQTHAALLAHVKTDNPVALELHPDIFKLYLDRQGFDVEPEKLHRIAARIAICGAIQKVPRLTPQGFGLRSLSDPDAKIYSDAFKDAQKEILTERCAAEFLLSMALIRRIEWTVSINDKTSSYNLKHIAEKHRCSYPTQAALGPSYVSNGLFIAAAVHSGFKYRNRYPSLNATFNMSERSIAALDYEIRPDGARAQDRRRKAEFRKWAA